MSYLLVHQHIKESLFLKGFLDDTKDAGCTDLIAIVYSTRHILKITVISQAACCSRKFSGNSIDPGMYSYCITSKGMF